MSRDLCSKTYEEMKIKRLKHPFDHSVYKLKEVAQNFERSMDDVRTIAKFKNGKASKHDLRGCTSEDIHIYLRRVPEHIAWVLGYHVLHGIDGLKGDGVLPAKINQLKAQYSPVIDGIVADCDRVSNLIRTNIKHEYDNFKHDNSDVFGLLNDALNVTDKILFDAGFYRG